MKTNKFTLLILFFISAICFAGVDKIKEKQQTTIQTDYPFKSTWLPTKEQINRSLNAIYKFLDSPFNITAWQKSEIAKIKENLSSYNVQFVGIELNGKKRIWCNFFPAKSFKKWKKQVVMVLDGGFWYWQIQYDLESNSCVNFRSNGYA